MSQQLDALAVANACRQAGIDLRAEVRSLSVWDAASLVGWVLLDPDDEHGSIDVDLLVRSIPTVGRSTAAKFLDGADIYGCKRVREVTPGRRQRLAELLIEWAGPDAARSTA